MKTPWPITSYLKSDFHCEARAHVASAAARRVEAGVVGHGGILRWPVAIRRSMADGRLRRERMFWLAVARTSR